MNDSIIVRGVYGIIAIVFTNYALTVLSFAFETRGSFFLLLMISLATFILTTVTIMEMIDIYDLTKKRKIK